MALPHAIGRYKVLGLLGQGAMGSVYLAHDPSLDRKVAVKTIKDFDLDATERRGYLQRFRNEAKAAARLSHPSIVQVFDVGEDEVHGPFLVFEYVEGTTLKALLREAPLTLQQIGSIVRQVSEALDVAHAAGVIHRDVKPDNILLTPTGRAKLADFGVARLPDAALTKDGHFLGTPCYSAPEAILKSRYSAQSDVFSLAAVTYEMASQHRAFPGTDALSVANSVINETPTPPSSHGRGDIATLDRVIMKGLAKPENERFSHAGEFGLAVTTALAQAGVTHPDVPSITPVRASRRDSTWIIAAVVLLAGLAGLAYRLQQQSTEVVIPINERHRQPDGPNTRRSRRARLPTEAATAPNSVTGETSITATDPLAGLSRREREEQAQDAIDQGRNSLRQGDVSSACAKAARARNLDPSSSDLAELLSELGTRCTP